MLLVVHSKGKAIELQALTGPEGSRRLRLPDFKTIGLVTWCVHTTSLDVHNILSTALHLSISQKALGTLPEDGNVMSKHVGATTHN
jgi:hypothetical protein